MAKKGQRTLGKRIRELRTALLLSQEELAYRAGLHRTYVGAVERGERNISLANILAIAKALKTPASELLRGVE